jgi:hypothetical protein
MPMQAVIETFAGTARLLPLYDSEDAISVPVNLAPSSTFAAGTVLGQITSAANDVQTITAPGSGTYILSGVNPLTGATFSTTALAFGANDAAIQAALVVALGAGPTVSSAAVTFAGAYASRPVALMTTTAGSVAHTTVGRTAQTMKAYASGSSDGSQVPTGILEHACTTDAQGFVITSSATGQGKPFASMYVKGTFATADLTGLDANAVTKLGGHLIYGTVTAGAFAF